jgi:hypothetical protein
MPSSDYLDCVRLWWVEDATSQALPRFTRHRPERRLTWGTLPSSAAVQLSAAYVRDGSQTS